MSEKTNFTTKLHKCCSDDKDELRPFSKAIHFVNGHAYASDGYIMVKTSLEYQSVLNPEKLEGKAIHKDNFKEILKFEIAECCEDGISCKNIDGQVAFYEYYDMKEAKTPNFESMIPDKSKLKDIAQIGINPKKMAALCEALYSETGTYRVRFTGNETAILIDVVGLPLQVGILMPIALSDSLFD